MGIGTVYEILSLLGSESNMVGHSWAAGDTLASVNEGVLSYGIILYYGLGVGIWTVSEI